MQRAIRLQTDATACKRAILKEFSIKAVSLANLLLKNRTSKKLMDLHKAMYSTCKETTSFNSQVICDIERSVVRSKGTNLKAITVKFNVPRNCKTFQTKTRTFIELGMYPRKRTAVPLRHNRNLQRYSSLLQGGWTCKTYGLTSDGQIVAYLSKEAEIPIRRNMLGVDVNSKCFAVSVLTPEGKILKQLYLGKDIWVKRKRIFERRERLQSFADRGSHRARQQLIRLKTKEQNFVRNRIGEVVRDITNLAVEYDADVAIEKLTRFKPKGRRFNKEVLRIPTFLFRTTLESRCFDKNIRLHLVNAYHTSKWCSHCGAVAKRGHSSNYALFKCGNCGQIVNSDRKASLAVAVKSLLVRDKHVSNQSASFQFTSRRVSVNGLFRSDDGVLDYAVHDI
ncbi:MAG: transposase [Candidatus Altiarchaeota archaeon]|nr:transposase [Candidatus Altiarchaeota archaeon]